ncbi:multicystatin [Eutrema salsugineum]|uniref:multicystatin n=1 Tax=Eutrema salsugineum TaxID=72664 RepID=UPI000CED2824|nr:multicystatin [Eutrema salsugineum]
MKIFNCLMKCGARNLILSLSPCVIFQGFDVDFTKLHHTFGAAAVDLDDSCLFSEPDTNRGWLDRLCGMAIAYYKEKTDTSLEYVKVLRANFHPSAGITLYITFEANDLSDGNQTKLYQAVVLYGCYIEVCSCRPKPSC